MLKLFIVDDEVSIIQLIRKLVSPEIAHEIVGETTDGLSALAMIEEAKPDIVITDIRMPGLNGVELIRRAREKQIQAEFIIISGYKDFAYARDAIRYGALEYLLKPIKAEELNAVLNTVLEKKGEKERLKTRIADMELTIAKNRREKRREVLAGYVRQIYEHTPQFCEKQVQVLKETFRIQEGVFSVLILKLDTEEAIETELILQNLEVLGDKYNRAIQELCYDSETYCEQSRCYVWFHTSVQRFSEIFRRLEALMEDNVSQYNLYRVSAAMGSMEADLWKLERAFESADYGIMQRFHREKERLIIYHGELDQVVYMPVSQELKGRLDRICYEFDDEAFDDLLCRVYQDLDRQYKGDLWCIRKYLNEMSGYVLFRLKTRDSGHVDEIVLDLQNGIRKKADLCCCEEEFWETYLEALTEQLKLEKQECKDGLRRPIKCMKQYMKEHFAEDVSLDEIVGAAELSNAYGSSIFKKETGMTITNYLIKVRMEEAQRLIRETSLTINEIAYKVGYTDARYFSKLFIKVVGIKPMDYRRFYNG